MADIEQRLKFIMDRGAQRQVEQGIRSLRDTIDDAAKGTQRAARGANQMEAALKDVGQEARRLNAALDDIEEPRKIKVDASGLSAQERFDQTSRGVALAGDVQSNLGALSGIAGAAGAGGLSQGIGLTGEIFALGEELPRLKSALAGIPDVARNAASALGTSVTALGGLGAATLGLVAVIAVAQRQAQESREVAQNQIDLLNRERELRIEAQSLTTQEIQARREELEVQRQIVEDRLADAQAMEEMLNNTGPVVRAVGEISAALGLADQSFSAMDDEVQAAKLAADELTQEMNILDEALSSSAVAANDAALAQEELAGKIANSVLAQAEIEGELAQFRQENAKLTQEELDRTKENLERRRNSLNAELQVLESSGNTSAQVTDRIKQLNSELATLGQKLKILGDTTIETSEETVKASRRQVQAARSTRGGSLLNGRGGILLNRRGGRQGTPAVNAALQEVYNEFAVKAFEAQSGLSESLRDVNKELSRSFEDLRINQSRDIEDAIRTGDILGIRDITRGVQRQAQDLNRDAARNRLDIEQDFTTQMIDLAQDRRNAILEAERQITESVRRTASRIGGLVLRSGNNGISFGSAPRT